LWSIVMLALAALMLIVTRFPFRPTLLLLMVFICMSVYNLFTSERGLHDRLSGTWLVPS
jgi:hypothetical protein